MKRLIPLMCASPSATKESVEDSCRHFIDALCVRCGGMHPTEPAF